MNRFRRLSTKNHEQFSIGEEIANSISHGIGALLAISALVLLVVFSAIRGSAIHIVSTAIYGATLMILYGISTLYHALTRTRAKRVFKILDHSSIYLLIAGTYTPFTLVTLQGVLGWTIFGVIWGLAALGILMKAFWSDRYVFLSTMIYVAMGWLIVIVFQPLVDSLAQTGVVLLVIGGVLYTVGTLFYLLPLFKFHHLVWHLFVLGGSLFHFFAVFFFVIPAG